MILPRFDVLVPNTVNEACSMLVKHANKGVRLLAGGTDLLVDLRTPIIPQHIPRCDGCPTHPEGSVISTIDCKLWASEPLMDSSGSLRALLQDTKQISPEYLISLHKLDELKGIQELNDGRLRVGALTTISEIERSSKIRKGWTALAEGADCLGSPLVRNRATLGGNIANARPAADTAVSSIALGGTLTLKGPTGKRTISAEDFPCNPGITVIKPDEILTFITYPAPSPNSGSAYYKLANRKALEISTVGIAVWITLEKPKNAIADMRLVLGAVGPTPILSESGKSILLGKVPDDAILKKAARAAIKDARPIDDHRGSAWYRMQMVEIITLRLLKVALKRAKKNR